MHLFQAGRAALPLESAAMVPTRLLCAALLACSLPAFGADPAPPSTNGWKRLKTEHFLVVGNAREAELKDAAIRLERFHHAWERLYGPVKLPVPNVVTVMKDNDALTPYKPRDRNGRPRHEFVGMFDRYVDHTQFTLAALDDPADTYIVLYNGYSSMLTRQMFGPMPRWVEIGLSEFFSAFHTDAKGHGILGRVPEWRKPTLSRGLMLPLERILMTDGAERTLSDQSERQIFYAESWGLVHYLLLNPERFQQFSVYLTAIAQGTPVKDAFTRAFGMTFDEMEAKLKAYLRATMLPLVTMDTVASVDAIKDMKTEAMPAEEALAVMGTLSQSVGDYKVAFTALRRALELGPKSVPVLTAAAALMMESGEFDDAVAVASKAAELAPDSFAAHYWLGEALLAEGQAAEAIAALGKATRLNTVSGQALFATSMAALALGRRSQSDATLTLARRHTSDPGWSLARARQAYAGGLFDLAASDAEFYVRDVGQGSDDAADGILLAALARMHLKQADAARPSLSALVASPGLPWQGTLARFLLGDLDERTLLDSAKHDGEVTEARVYAGLKAAVDGRIDEAVAHLQWAKEKGRRDYRHEYRLALLELIRLTPPPPAPGGPNTPSSPPKAGPQTAGRPAPGQPAA